MTINFSIARRRLGLSQETVADRLGTTDKAISRWETSGKITGANLVAMAALYKVPAEILMKHDGDGLNDYISPDGKPSMPAPVDQDTAVQIEAALKMYRQQLTAFAKRDLLPLDEDTIDLAVEVMRDRMQKDASGEHLDEINLQTDVIAIQAQRKRSS